MKKITLNVHLAHRLATAGRGGRGQRARLKILRRVVQNGPQRLATSVATDRRPGQWMRPVKKLNLRGRRNGDVLRAGVVLPRQGRGVVPMMRMVARS